MKNNKLIIPLFFFLFLFFLKPSFAFTQFNLNPSFASTYNGYAINDISSNIAITTCSANPTTWFFCIYSWLTGKNYSISADTYSCFNPVANTSWHNATGGNYTGFLDLRPSTNCTWANYSTNSYHYLSIKMLDNENFFSFKTYLDIDVNSDWYDNNSYFVLPSNKEGLIFLRYLVNETDNYFPSESSLQYFSSDGSTGSVALLPSENTWINTTLIIPASLSSRNITIYATFKWSGNVFSTAIPIRVMIDYFKFFTFDNEEVLPSSYSSTYVQNACNSTNTQTTIGGTLTCTSFPGKSTYVLNSAESNSNCVVYQNNNSIFVRRLINYYQNSPTVRGSDFMISRDIGTYAFHGASPSNIVLPIIITQLTPYSIVFSTINPPVSCEGIYGTDCNVVHFDFSDSGTILLSTLHGLGNTSYCYNLNYVPSGSAGTQYQFHGGDAGNTGLQNIFRTSCAYQTICKGNSKYVINTLCQNILIASCGVWGCNDAETDCNYPVNPITNETIQTYGSYCMDNYTYIIVNSTGSYFDSCTYPQLCYQSTSTTISCLTEAEKTEANATTATNIMVNPANAIALMIGGTFGISDLPMSRTMSSIIISFIGSAIMIIVIAKYASEKIEGKALTSFFLFGVLILLVFFTYPIGWFPAWLLFIIIALDGFTIYQIMKSD